MEILNFNDEANSFVLNHTNLRQLKMKHKFKRKD
jgi:hypothetical protein